MSRRLVMWDIDWTLLWAGGVTNEAFQRAFVEATGRLPEWVPTFAGRTDLSILTEIFARHGLPAPDLGTFLTRFAEEFAGSAHLVPQRGRVLPGAREILAALRRDDVVQTTVTGNIRANAQVKLTAFDLAAGLDLTVGGYGEEHVVRAELVAASLRRARARYGDFAEVIVVGDSRHDVEAALTCGITAVAVASGPAGAEELRAAGAHAVLDSLTDTPAVLALLTGEGEREPRGGGRVGTVA